MMWTGSASMCILSLCSLFVSFLCVCLLSSFVLGLSSPEFSSLDTFEILDLVWRRWSRLCVKHQICYSACFVGGKEGFLAVKAVISFKCKVRSRSEQKGFLSVFSSVFLGWFRWWKVLAYVVAGEKHSLRCCSDIFFLFYRLGCKVSKFL